MAKLASRLIRVLLPLALLLPTAVANAAPSGESGDQKFADNLNRDGMLFNFNLQRRIAQDYCDSIIRSWQYSSTDLNKEVTKQLEEDYGLPSKFAEATVWAGSRAYCLCTGYFVAVNIPLLTMEDFYRPLPKLSTFPLLDADVWPCSAYETDSANKLGYQLPVTR